MSTVSTLDRAAPFAPLAIRERPRSLQPAPDPPRVQPTPIETPSAAEPAEASSEKAAEDTSQLDPYLVRFCDQRIPSGCSVAFVNVAGPYGPEIQFVPDPRVTS